MENDTLIVRIIGGLGNQMFQYAAARSLAIRLNKKLKLDLRAFDKYTLHEFGLNQFKVEYNVATLNDLKCYPQWLGWAYRKVPCLPRTKDWYVEGGFGFDQSWNHLPQHVYFIDGYFQSQFFFHKHRSVFKDEFNLIAPFSKTNKKFSEIAESNNSVSIHVRRGNYVTDSKALATHGICQVSYYKAAVRLIRSKVANPVFLVFSNDLNWANENLDLGNDAQFVEGNGDQPQVDLVLMSKCKHHIIANSSFSWWGAWLGESRNSVIVAPDPWFDDEKIDAKDLLPDSWIRLKKNG